jgi:hypothetical protein
MANLYERKRVGSQLDVNRKIPLAYKYVFFFEAVVNRLLDLIKES